MTRAGCAVLAACALLLSASSAWAQSCGGSAGPSIAGGASGGGWLRPGEAAARLSEEYEVKDRSFKGAHSVENDFDESLFISRTALDAQYGVAEDWSAELTVTYPHFTYRVKPPGGERIVRRFRGPGDTLVAAGWRVWSEGDCPLRLGVDPKSAGLPDAPERHASGGGSVFAAWFGAWLPTGDTKRPDPRIVTRDVSVSNLQTGTGTFDPFLRLRYDRNLDRFGLFAEVDLRVPLYENRYDYRTADTEALVVGAGTRVISKLSASLALMYQRVGTDQFRGDDVGVGGARWIYAIPGLSWQFTDAAALDFSVRLPLYRRTETKLSDSNAAFQVGLSWRF